MAHITTSLYVRRSVASTVVAFVLFALGVVATVQASPVIIYSNLGPGASYGNDSSYAVEFGPAMPFTVPVGPDYKLTQIDIALTDQEGPGTASAIVNLMTDADGSPGSIILTRRLIDLPNWESSTTIGLSQTISEIAGITLSGGKRYWLAVFPGDPDTQAGWNFNSMDQWGDVYYSYNGGILVHDMQLGAFDVLGEPITAACQPLTITDLDASPATLWPPNHKMVLVKVIGATTGGCGAVSCQINNVTSNESLDAGGDWQITGPLTLNMRAERRGNARDRIYTISVQCTDSESNSDQSATIVVVPHDQGKK